MYHSIRAAVLLLFSIWFTAFHAPIHATEANTPDQLAARSYQILREHCFQCHGKVPQKIKGDLKILEHAELMKNPHKIIVPGRSSNSLMIQKIEKGEMPKGKRPSVPPEDLQVLKDWIEAGAPEFPKEQYGPSPSALLLASDAKQVFKAHCFDCHGGAKTMAKVKILDSQLLAKRQLVLPGNASDSQLYYLISKADSALMMPPTGQPRLSSTEIATIRRWIDEGAIPFPEDKELPATIAGTNSGKGLGVEYILKSILTDVSRQPKADRPFLRYFSLTHTLTAGATEGQLRDHRFALAKAINHLTWEKELVKPRAIEDTETIFAVDLRKLGWDRQPFNQIVDGQARARSRFNLFDLILLEYPYGLAYLENDPEGAYARLINEFLIPARQIRPIPYVRADWFVSTATQPPLYEDLLQLPRDVAQLEQQLGVDSQENVDKGKAIRAGMAISGVSSNNRVVERHEMLNGAYWKSFDFSSNKGQENLYRDPIRLQASGGEMIFSLPNGLQGYLIVDNQGRRLDAAPTEIVTDIHAADKVVRNGLACMRCHDQGIKEFSDTVRATLEFGNQYDFDRDLALKLYRPQKEMDKLVEIDKARFTKAMERLLGGPQPREPLTRVSKSYLDDPIGLSAASAELGLAEPKTGVFQQPALAGLGLVALATPEGRVRRDMWSDSYDQAIRELNLGQPIVSMDAMSRPDYSPSPAPFQLTLRTNEKAFAPGDQMAIFVRADRDVYIELFGTDSEGQKIPLAAPQSPIPANKDFRFPETGFIEIQPTKGREFITVYASDSPFPPATILRGPNIRDRLVHRFRMSRRGNTYTIAQQPDPLRTVKKTIEIETK